jgi:hypothetical protein
VVANEGDSDRSVILVATVRGMTNDFREDFVVAVPGASRDASFLLAPGESVLSDVTWFTREVAPGPYRVTVQAWSGDRTSLLSERAVQVTVAETRRIDALSVLSGSGKPRSWRVPGGRTARDGPQWLQRGDGPRSRYRAARAVG